MCVLCMCELVCVCVWLSFAVFIPIYIRCIFVPPNFVDERTKEWFLSGSITPLIMILVTYLYFCLYAGPRYMAKRKPFKLEGVLIAYNAVQVLLSIVLVYEVSVTQTSEAVLVAHC